MSGSFAPSGSALTLKFSDTVSQLKAGTFNNGDQIEVLGYNTKGDGGGGIFVYDDGSSVTVDNGVVIAPNSGVGRFIRVIENGVIPLECYGITLTSNSTGAAFKTAVESAYAAAIANKAKVTVPALNIAPSTTIVLTGGSAEIDFGKCKIKRTDATKPILQQHGTQPSTFYSPNTDILGKNSPVFSISSSNTYHTLRFNTGIVATAGFAVGDWLAVLSDATYTTNKAPDDGKFGCLRQALAISPTADDVRIEILTRDFKVSESFKVGKVALQQGAIITGGEFYDDPSILSASYADPIIRFYLCYRPVIRQAIVHDLCGKGIELNWCYQGLVEKCIAYNLPNNLPTQAGYGVMISGGSLQCKVDSCLLEKCRHGFTTDRNFVSGVLRIYGGDQRTKITNCLFRDNTSYALDTHEETEDFSAIENIVMGGTNANDSGGIQIRAIRGLVEGNDVVGCVDTGIQVGNDDCFIVGNRICYTQRLQAGTTRGFGIRSDFRAAIVGNLFIGNGTGDVNVNGVNNYVANNRFGSSEGVRLGASSTENRIVGNYFYFCGTAISELAGATNNYFSQNYYRSTSGMVYKMKGTNQTYSGNQALSDAAPLASATTLAAGTQIVPVENIVTISSAADVTLTATPTINTTILTTFQDRSVSDGQRLRLLNTGSFNITLQDKNILANTGLDLGGSNYTLRPGQSLDLVYRSSSSTWLSIQPLSLGKTKHYKGSTVPVSPVTGDTWDELNGSDLFIQSWFWNGSRWLSTGLYPASFSAESQITANNTIGTILVLDTTSWDVYIQTFHVDFYTNAVNNPSNYWTVTLQKRDTSSPANSINLASVNSSDINNGEWGIKKATVNTLVDVSTPPTGLIQALFTTTLTPSGLFQACATINFRWVRL